MWIFELLVQAFLELCFSILPKPVQVGCCVIGLAALAALLIWVLFF